MSVEPEERGSLLASLAGEYDPSEEDAERVFAKIQASLAENAAVTPSASGRAESTPMATGGAKKTLALGVSCAALAIIGALTFGRGDSSAGAQLQPQSQPHAETSSAIAAPTAEREPEATPVIPSVSIDSLPSATARPVGHSTPKAAPPATPSEPAPSTDTLEREARILADARRARQAGDGDRALALLEEHAREFPRGWLASDRAAERIVTLCALGRREEAVRDGAAFLDGRPKSPLTRRVEMSCAGRP